MKLGAAWYGFREQTAANYFEMASALGLRYVEIPLYWQIIEDSKYHYHSSENIRGLLAMADRAGVRIVSSVSDFPITFGATSTEGKFGQSTVDFGMAAARRTIDLGAQLGLEVLRIVEPNINPDDLDTARSRMEECGKAMCILGDYAADRGVRIAVENYGLTSEQVNWLLDKANHSAVGTLYDPCNYYRIGEDPLQALKNLGGRVSYCHLKDAFRNDPRSPDSLFKGSRWPPSEAVGEGEVDWGPILKELSTFYDGYLCFEYEIAEDVMRGTRVSIEHIRRISGQLEISLKLEEGKQ